MMAAASEEVNLAGSALRSGTCPPPSTLISLVPVIGKLGRSVFHRSPGVFYRNPLSRLCNGDLIGPVESAQSQITQEPLRWKSNNPPNEPPRFRVNYSAPLGTRFKACTGARRRDDDSQSKSVRGYQCDRHHRITPRRAKMKLHLHIAIHE